MRLLLITSSFPFGDGETFLEQEIYYLSNSFENVDILVVNPKSILQKEIPINCKVHTININENFYIKFLSVFSVDFYKELFSVRFYYKKKISLGIIKEIINSIFFSKKIKSKLEDLSNKQKYDVLYTYWMNDSALAVAKLKTNNEVIKVTRAHGFDLYFERSSYNYLPFKLLTYKKFNQIHFISEDGKNYFVNKHKIKDQSKIFVSRLGIDNKLNKTLKKDNNHFVVLTNSFIYPNKRISKIADVINLLDIQVTWYHIGNGVETKFQDDFLNYVNKIFGKRNNIDFKYLGKLSNSNVFQFLENTKIDLFINLSLSEGIPVTMMEVFSFGIPVLTNSVGGIPEIVNDSNGILVGVMDSPEEIVLKIIKFAQLSDLKRNQISKNAFKTWFEIYNASINYPKFIEIVKK